MGVWISNSCDVLRYELRLGSPDGSWWLSVLDFLNFSVNLLRQFEVTEDFFWLFWSPARSPPRLFVSKSSSFFRRVEPLKVFLAAESRSKRPLPMSSSGRFWSSPLLDKSVVEALFFLSSISRSPRGLSPLLPKVRNLRFRRRLPNWSESLSEPPASEAKLSLEAVVEAPRRLRCCWFLKALRCTVGDSTFSLSILKVSRISSFLKCSIVSAISLALPPRFLVRVSFRCSLRLLGVVVRLKGYFLAICCPGVGLFSFFSSLIVSKKSAGTSMDLRAIESMNFLALLVAVGVFCSVCSGSSVSLLGFRTYRETFSSEGFRPSSRINRFRSSPLTSAEPPGGVFFLGLAASLKPEASSTTSMAFITSVSGTISVTLDFLVPFRPTLDLISRFLSKYLAPISASCSASLAHLSIRFLKFFGCFSGFSATFGSASTGSAALTGFSTKPGGGKVGAERSLSWPILSISGFLLPLDLRISPRSRDP